MARLALRKYNGTLSLSLSLSFCLSFSLSLSLSFCLSLNFQGSPLTSGPRTRVAQANVALLMHFRKGKDPTPGKPEGGIGISVF